MSQPLISIITVVRNAPQALAKTIQSVQAQTYPNIEYVVVDGLSTDQTPEVIRQYSSRIQTWVSEKDKNLYDAMNKGLKLSTGEFVWFLHAGDIIPTPQTLERAFKNYQNQDLIYGEAKVVQTDGSLRAWHKKTPHTLSWHSFEQGMIVCHQSMILRRAAAELYDLRWVLAGDIDWCLRSLRNVHQSLYVGEDLCHFAAGGLSSKRKKASLLERFRILKSHFGLVKTLWIHLKIALKIN
ncbi:MAG: glycosyltransferase [Cytophagales bacterium]|nr:MAG: glycosyltransferase [Cytophagales bacterium]